MHSAPEPRPVGDGQVSRDLRRPDPAEVGREQQPDAEIEAGQRAGQATELLGGPV